MWNFVSYKSCDALDNLCSMQFLLPTLKIALNYVRIIFHSSFASTFNIRCAFCHYWPLMTQPSEHLYHIVFYIMFFGLPLNWPQTNDNQSLLWKDPAKKLCFTYYNHKMNMLPSHVNTRTKRKREDTQSSCGCLVYLVCTLEKKTNGRKIIKKSNW